MELEDDNIFLASKYLFSRFVGQQLRSQRPNLGHTGGGPRFCGLHREEREGPGDALLHQGRRLAHQPNRIRQVEEVVHRGGCGWVILPRK